jgi:hypothetical protein
MGFAPKMNADDFRTVWTAGSGWGTYSQKADPAKGLVAGLEAAAGGIDLKEFDLTLPPEAAGKDVRSIKTQVAGAPAPASFRKEGDIIRVFWIKPVRVEPGKPLAVAIAF